MLHSDAEGQDSLEITRRSDLAYIRKAGAEPPRALVFLRIAGIADLRSRVEGATGHDHQQECVPFQGDRLAGRILGDLGHVPDLVRRCGTDELEHHPVVAVVPAGTNGPQQARSGRRGAALFGLEEKPLGSWRDGDAVPAEGLEALGLGRDVEPVGVGATAVVPVVAADGVGATEPGLLAEGEGVVSLEPLGVQAARSARPAAMAPTSNPLQGRITLPS